MARTSKYTAAEKWIITQFRGLWSTWPAKDECITAARRGPDKYECAHCLKLFRRSMMQADHKSPAIDPIRGYEGKGIYAERLFVGVEALQALCIDCHKVKTVVENKIRAAEARKRTQSTSE
jgi:5-methylcytosine-specific restriction endonuclease McrA